MKKLFDSKPVLFAVSAIVIYVVGFSFADGISEDIGFPYIVSLVFAAVLLAVLIVFAKHNELMEHMGLCGFKGKYKTFLYFVPLAVIASINLWNGVGLETGIAQVAVCAAAKGIAGAIEEIIFRGLLFTALCKENVRSAFVISSLTFGIGHIVNLLNGASVFETLCQMIYACAIGFCFTAVFYKGKSIIPCIAVHVTVNATSAFGMLPEGDAQMFFIAATVVLTVVSVGYGVWLLLQKDSGNAVLSE